MALAHLQIDTQGQERSAAWRPSGHRPGNESVLCGHPFLLFSVFLLVPHPDSGGPRGLSPPREARPGTLPPGERLPVNRLFLLHFAPHLAQNVPSELKPCSVLGFVRQPVAPSSSRAALPPGGQRGLLQRGGAARANRAALPAAGLQVAQQMDARGSS